MKKILAAYILFLFCLTSVRGGVDESADAYIRAYSDIAVGEMYRSGVPASITLSQGMLESQYGKSMLAVEANNHFGIKCHSDWKGESVAKDDDAKGECFRKYPSAADSYRDHSDFLRFKQRYAGLFNFEITDYKSWAYGLSKAGYATDPNYAPKLITIIEKYELYRFDRPDTSSAVAAVGQIPAPPAELSRPVRYEGKGRNGTFAVMLSREVMTLNGVPFVYARDGETYRSISAQYNLFPRELASFNDRSDVDAGLVSGEKVYLARKSSRAVKGMEKHICDGNETLLDIAGKYAVRLKCLMKYNGIDDASRILQEDDTILLLAPSKKSADGRKEKK